MTGVSHEKPNKVAYLQEETCGQHCRARADRSSGAHMARLVWYDERSGVSGK